MLIESVDGEPLGWYLGHVQRDGTSEIIQIGALDGSDEVVLGAVLHDCMTRGAALVQGRSEARLLRPALVEQLLLPARRVDARARTEQGDRRRFRVRGHVPLGA